MKRTWMLRRDSNMVMLGNDHQVSNSMLNTIRISKVKRV